PQGETLPLPVLFLEDDVLECLDGVAIRLCASERGPRQLGSSLQPRHDDLAGGRMPNWFVKRTPRLDLRLREAAGTISSRTRQRLRIEAARPWIFEDAVGYTVEAIAGVQDCLMNQT